MATILFFGKLQDLTAHHANELEIPQTLASIGELRKFVDGAYQMNGVLLAESVRVAVNGEIVFDTDQFLQADEIAFMPPVGGG